MNILSLWKVILLSSLVFFCALTPGYARDITFAWDANSPEPSGYKVYYKIGFSGGPPYNGTGATEGDSPIDVGNVTTYTLHGLSDTDIYFFAATAYNDQGESGYSNEASTLRVTSITSSTSNGSYNAGKTIDITVVFSEAVTLAGGNLIVALNTGRTIEIGPFTSQSSVGGTYTVQAGDNSSDLNVNSLTLSGGTLQNAGGTDCNLLLPTGSNLADNKDIIVASFMSQFTLFPGILVAFRFQERRRFQVSGVRCQVSGKRNAKTVLFSRRTPQT